MALKGDMAMFQFMDIFGDVMRVVTFQRQSENRLNRTTRDRILPVGERLGLGGAPRRFAVEQCCSKRGEGIAFPG